MPGVWETDAEWRRLKRELEAWREHRVRADVLGQHRSQLGAAFTLVDKALDQLREPIVSMSGTAGNLTVQCRVHDRRLAWLRRVWGFFRERFDQRDDPTLAPLLHGADEVVWSCHREPFAALEVLGGDVAPPSPLPYAEPSLTPEVFPHGLVPGALRRDIDTPFLRRTLDQLPFAVVRVPVACATAPWWLVHLGHEVGHVVDERLLGYGARCALVERAGLEPASASDWTQWSGETFADMYAALMHGPWAVWALAVAESHDDETMTVRRDTYPPPVVRLLVMTHVCVLAGASTDDLQADADRWERLVSADSTMASMVADGRRVVEAFLAHEVCRMSWLTLADWDASQWQRSSLRTWLEQLPRRPAVAPPRPRRSWARMLVAASVLRRKDGEGQPVLPGADIGEDLLTWLPVVREPGSRAAGDEVTSRVQAQGVALARELMAMEPMP